MSKKGQPLPKYTPEQRREFVERVCELYETQHATVESCCKAVGVSAPAFRIWVNESSENSERYKKAKEKQDAHYWQDIIRPLTKTSLQRLLEGEETEDTEVRDLSDKGLPTGHTATTIKRSKTQPNAAAVIFTLKGLYPDMFADRSLVNMKVESIEGEVLSPETLDDIERHLAAKRSDEGTPLPRKSKG